MTIVKERITLDTIYLVQERLESEDKFYSLGLFSSSQNFTSTLSYDNFNIPSNHTTLSWASFTVKEHEYVHKRVIYGPLDYLGDVGGLADALLWIGSSLIYLI